MDERVVFRETLLLRRGTAGWTLLAVGIASALVGSVVAASRSWWGLVGVTLGAGLFMATWFGGGETVVTTSAVLRRVRPLPRQRRIPITDVTSTEITIADFQTSMFGGWEGSRGGLHGAVVESLEGPKQVGNRAVRLHLRSGEVVQFATWKPNAVMDAIRSAQEADRV